MDGFTSIEAIKRANQRIGHHWFDADTLRYFGTRILPTVYNGCYFITAENQFQRSLPKRYTIRKARESGEIDTVGEFQAYATRAQAVSAIKQVIKVATA